MSIAPGTPDGRRRRRSDGDSEAGFTLIEMVVVMLIFASVVGVIAAGTVQRDRTPSPFQMAKQIQSITFRARSDAIQTSQRRVVVIDTKAMQIRYLQKDEITLPESHFLKVLAGQELVAADGQVLLVFLPDGSSSGAEITLADNRKRTALIKVNWLTGLPVISGGTVN